MEKISKSKRLKQIVELINEREYASVAELAVLYSVSEMSIRTDLNELHEEGEIVRCHGGAKKKKTHGIEMPLHLDRQSKLYKKIMIGKAAAKLINYGDSIMFDTGTTVEQIANNIPENLKLTVITNSINILNILIKHPNINIYVPNGKIDANTSSIVGAPAERSLAQYFAKIAFISVGGVSKRGLENNSHEAANIAKILIQNAERRVLVADSGKVNHGGIFNICSINEINTFITDSSIDQEFCRELADMGVEVIVADDGLAD